MARVLIPGASYPRNDPKTGIPYRCPVTSVTCKHDAPMEFDEYRRRSEEQKSRGEPVTCYQCDGVIPDDASAPLERMEEYQRACLILYPGYGETFTIPSDYPGPPRGERFPRIARSPSPRLDARPDAAHELFAPRPAPPVSPTVPPASPTPTVPPASPIPPAPPVSRTGKGPHPRKKRRRDRRGGGGGEEGEEGEEEEGEEE